MLDYKTDLEISKLSISIPSKVDNHWKMKLTYNSAELYFQTPSLKLDKKSNKLSFNSSKKSVFFNFIDNLEEKIIDKLHSNSETLFKGKIFSKEKLKNSLITSWNVSDEGLVSLDCTNCVTEKTKYLSTFDDNITYEELSDNVLCIVHLDYIIFSKNNFELKYFLTHIKSKKIHTSVDSIFEKKNTPVEDDNLDFFNE